MDDQSSWSAPDPWPPLTAGQVNWQANLSSNPRISETHRYKVKVKCLLVPYQSESPQSEWPSINSRIEAFSSLMIRHNFRLFEWTGPDLEQSEVFFFVFPKRKKLCLRNSLMENHWRRTREQTGTIRLPMTLHRCECVFLEMQGKITTEKRLSLNSQLNKKPKKNKKHLSED